jgi:hypothetical protein
MGLFMMQPPLIRPYLSFPVLGGDYVSDNLYVTSGLPTYAQPILSTQLSVYVFYPVYIPFLMAVRSLIRSLGRS